MADPTPPPSSIATTGRLESLDGWRAISILLVLASHMLPLGPRAWDLNFSVGLVGMSIFFTLSGFLITKTLFRNPSVPAFLVLRLTRILPLAWVATFVYLAMERAGFRFYPPTLGFVINYDDQYITHLTGPFWSLCVEVHFYAAAAILVGLFGLRGLLILPFVALVVTGLRVQGHDPASLKTHLRVDEILTGTTLAMVWLDRLGRPGRLIRRVLEVVPTVLWAVVFLASCHRLSGYLVYLRPYLASAMVGSSILGRNRLTGLLTSRPARYLAEVSYAVYVIHTGTMYGWLGSGNTLVKYAKRPLCFAITFVLAHASTFAFERPCTAFGKRLSRRWDNRHPHPVPAGPAPLGPNRV